MGSVLAFIGLFLLAIPVAKFARALFRPAPGNPPHDSIREVMGPVELTLCVTLLCLGALSLVLVAPDHAARSMVVEVACPAGGLDMTNPNIYDRHCTTAPLAAGKGTVAMLAVRGVDKLGYWKLTVEQMKVDPQSPAWLPLEYPRDVMKEFMNVYARQAVPVGLPLPHVVRQYQVEAWKFESADELPNIDLAYCFAFVLYGRPVFRQDGSEWLYEVPMLTRGNYCGSVLDAVTDANIERVLGALRVSG